MLPDNLTFIGDKAFQNCKNLTKLIFPSTYKAPTLTLGTQLFLKCTKFTGIVVEDGANVRLDDAGVLYTADGKTLIAATDSFKATSYTVADGVETISPSAFYSKTGLTTITLPASMKSIGDKAFYGCTGLTAITFPDGMSSLGVNAFDGCTKLATVGFGKSLTAVPAYAFNKCAALKTADLPASVTCIDDYAFYNCSSLTSVTFPDGLTEVAKYAFNGCSKLKNGNSACIGNDVGGLCLQRMLRTYGCGLRQRNGHSHPGFLRSEGSEKSWRCPIMLRRSEIMHSTIAMY